MRERERCGRGQERRKHIIHIFILEYSCALTLLPSREIDRSTNLQIDDLEPQPWFSSGAEMNESPAMRNKSSFGRALQNLNVHHIQKVSRCGTLLRKDAPEVCVRERSCCSRRRTCWNLRRLVSSAATGRHLFEHIWLLFGEKKEQMRFAVRDKSVRALWENMIGPVGAEELKNRPPHPSCFKLSATVLNSISSVYLSAGRQTRLFCRRRLKE